MKKSQMKTKIADIISNINEIISYATEHNYASDLQKCRDDLQRVLISINKKEKKMDFNKICFRIFQLIDIVWLVISKKE